MSDQVSIAESVSNHPDGWRRYLHPRVAAILLLGFSAGLPLLLIFATLSLWLTEAGVGRAAVTYFSWAALGYSFKFVWAPLVDKLPIPLLSATLGQRRAWILLAQLSVVSAIVLMAMSDPASPQGLETMALAAVFLGFSSATQDIVIDAYRIEAVEKDLQALMASSYVAGYRIGMLVAGAGSLYLADGLGTSSEQYRYSAWMWTYLAMALTMGVGIATTLVIREPVSRNPSTYLHGTLDYIRFVGGFGLFVSSFILSYQWLAPIIESAKASLFFVQWLPLTNDVAEPLNAFLAEAFRMTGS
ncbi:MAG: MFS transporter, partial [Gammaproteobacteria bacterium]